jgi:hypothetical protein
MRRADCVKCHARHDPQPGRSSTSPFWQRCRPSPLRAPTPPLRRLEYDGMKYAGLPVNPVVPPMNQDRCPPFWAPPDVVAPVPKVVGDLEFWRQQLQGASTGGTFTGPELFVRRTVHRPEGSRMSQTSPWRSVSASRPKVAWQNLSRLLPHSSCSDGDPCERRSPGR